ncbi:hypothetical protein RRF57_008525 [Xylaria bambusicola]|uniref:Uncharacterized protein n=1 Tax=Xylaria bambusicola TaxID=326684 RepID=A0AAN7ZB16_9PEZI
MAGHQSIRPAAPADDVIAEGVGDFSHAVDAPPEGIAAAKAAATARPAPAQLVQPAAAGRTVLRQKAATRRTRVAVIVDDYCYAAAAAELLLRQMVRLWRVREG